MTTKSVKDYYAILDVPQNATTEEIRLAYRKKARLFHPDLSADPNAEERFREINEAYEILADSEKRRAYDFFVAEATTEEGTGVPGDDEHLAGDQPVAPPPTVTPPPATPPPPTHPPEEQAPPKEPRRRVYPPTWAILLIFLGACIILGVIAGGILSLQRDRPTGGAESLTVSKLTTFLSPPTIPPDITVIEEDNTPVTTVGPKTLNITGSSYPIVAVVPEQGRWPLPLEERDLGLWMYGTLINYVIGLPASLETEALLADLSSGDRITLTLQNGTQLHFGSPQVKRVDVADASPMVQDKPGLTLMVLGAESASRLVVKARYLPEDTRPAGQQSSEGIAVEVLSSGIVEDVVPQEPDSWYFVVEYQVMHDTATLVDPTFFVMVLEDAEGRRYNLNDAATTLGSYGELVTSIPAGAPVQGSAGYLIPKTVKAPLIWNFRAEATSTDPATFVLGFEPPRPAPAQPDVELLEVFLDARRDVIVVSGTVYNDGESELNVTSQDVAMTAGGGQSALQAAAPLLPWAVAPGGYQDFEMQFTVPDGTDAALLDILGFAFEIEGLSP
jgi:hypothetical protein